MTNPWLTIPAEDYEGHMASPDVGQLQEQDFTSATFIIEPVSLVLAALVFEYVGVREAVRNISRSLAAGGVLVTALQLASLTSAPVTRTRFKSLEALAPIMNLVSPEEFSRVCFENGLKEVRRKRIPLKQGKELCVGFYKKECS